jgi:hypothetical protein
MNVTARFALLTAALVAFATDRIGAEEPAAPVKPDVSSNAVIVAGAAIPLTNKALLVISKLRGVEPADVKIRVSVGGAGGAFEIDIADAKDAAKEAEELSKEFGAAAAVILEHVSDDGVVRTNWTFKSGTVRQLTAPVGASGLKPRARRMYVWPTTAALKPPAAPAKLRVRASIN